MAEDFAEIQPDELKFIFEPNKQISCILNLINKSNLHLAFKVKTTDPKLYCVRPNKGIVKPNSTCEVLVRRQLACKFLPLAKTISKQKFMIERTFVSEDTTLEEVESVFCSNNGCDNINVKKLKVVLEEQDLEKIEARAEETLEMKLKIKDLELRLTQAEETISKLKEQKNECDGEGKKAGSRLFVKCFNLKFV